MIALRPVFERRAALSSNTSAVALLPGSGSRGPCPAYTPSATSALFAECVVRTVWSGRPVGRSSAGEQVGSRDGAWTRRAEKLAGVRPCDQRGVAASRSRRHPRSVSTGCPRGSFLGPHRPDQRTRRRGPKLRSGCSGPGARDQTPGKSAPARRVRRSAARRSKTGLRRSGLSSRPSAEGRLKKMPFPTWTRASAPGLAAASSLRRVSRPPV